MSESPNTKKGILSGMPWTGGKCGAVQAMPCTPMCFWPDDQDKLMKVYKCAAEGLETKFKGFGDTKYPLKSFGLDVLKHLEECGMKGVFHLKDVNKKSPCIIHSGRYQTTNECHDQSL